MFDYTKWERIKIYWLYFWKGVFEVYEMDCKRFVPILKKTDSGGMIFYLMFSKDFSFLILKEVVSEEGAILTNLESAHEFDRGFCLLFSSLLPGKKEEIERLTNSSLPYYTNTYIEKRWDAICEALKRKELCYAVVEQTCGGFHIAASTFLINNGICNGIFFMGAHTPETEVEALRDEKEQAITVADVARKQFKAVLGIGIIHGSGTTTIAVDDEKKGVTTLTFSHAGIYEVKEQVPRMTVEKLGDLLEDVYNLHTIRFRLYS